TCQLAEITLSAREVLELGPGAVLAFDKPIGSPVELLAGGSLVARGELVAIDGELGVRILELA
ncbi:MAG: FliM/FliN family flagellar motor C-terminal domain-containing protein, partial [Pseudomonadota bacterium]